MALLFIWNALLFTETFSLRSSCTQKFASQKRYLMPQLTINKRTTFSSLFSESSVIESTDSDSNPFMDSILKLFPWLDFNRDVGSSPKAAQKVNNPICKPKNAILVFGATGRAGIDIVKEFSSSGRDVVIVSRRDINITNFIKEKLGSDINTSKLFFNSNIDITNASTITSNIFDGVTQVISSVGAVFNESSLTPENVDFKGNINIFKASQKYILKQTEVVSEVFSFAKKDRNIKNWISVDDVIMGGSSSSKWDEMNVEAGDEDFCRWSGNVNVIDGGFCGTSSLPTLAPVNVNGFDGIKIRVKGDGNRYKFRVKLGDYQYQSFFDTIDGVWQDISLPFDSFICVRQTQVDYNAPPIASTNDPANSLISSFGIVYSRFGFNKAANPKFTSTSFKIDVSNISIYKSPRPTVILISSAGTERINRITEEDRLKDIPIVQLNPLGILNWKYKAEDALRKSGLDYTIVRATGLVPAASVLKDSDSTVTVRKMDLQQGDAIAGRITRPELAKSLVKIVESPYSVGKTFEIRRDETDSGVYLSSDISPDRRLPLQLQRLVRDADRSGGLLPPLPVPREAPGAVSAERKAQILADPRVQAQQLRDKGNKDAA